MKVILGVDPQGQYLEALRLLARLKLPHLQMVMVHVREGEEELDASLMAHAAKTAYDLGFHANEYSEEGDAATVLTRVAALEDAELIALGSGDKGPLNVLLHGSVGKDVMSSWQGSILVAKGRLDSYGSLRAVMGYDDSLHSRRALTRFVKWAAAGIRHIEVLTVELPLVAEFDALRSDHERATTGTLAFAAETVDHIATRAAKVLIDGGYNACPIGSVGDIVEELERAMISTSSDLLILPAERHGLLDRVLFGSVSMAALKEHHSMLVIR